MTTPPDRELEIFSAVRRLPKPERAAYLDKACAGDTALRQHIEALLSAGDEAGGFLEQSPVVPPKHAKVIHQAFSQAEKIGDKIGHYKLLQQIGEGGCGVVYMAEQDEPVRRRVALKVIKLGMDTKNVIARFEGERQALALMDHPNIAKVLDAGATDTGRPYFVMELVRGIKITDYCDENNLSTRERLELFIQVCRAIQHAHQNSVIHRDIKPSNILVTMNDGVPLPKVIDFGIAKATHGKLTDQTLFTAFEQFIGTPAYMSPEQAEMSAQAIDTRSDIYSLGVLLYELLTDQTPFDAKKLLQAGLDEIRRTIREDEPARPSTRLSTMLVGQLKATARKRQTEPPKLIHLVRGDLDWIVMKTLEKDRTRRYETANGLAMDIQRHLNSEPVGARPPSEFYRIQKLVSRHKLAFISAGVVIVALIFALGGTVVAMLSIQRENHQVRRAKDDATEKLRGAYLAEARILRTSGQAGQRFGSLETVLKAAAIRPDLSARNEAIAALAMSDMRLFSQSSFAAGQDATARDNNSFVWSDGTRGAVSQGSNSFAVLATGGAFFYTTTGNLNVEVDPTGDVDFSSTTRQMLNLWSTIYGIGVQSSTLYQRTAAGGGFAWYAGGVHNNGQDNPGGGTTVMTLDGSGDLNVTANASVCSLTIRGGCDLAEPFQISFADQEVPLGAVVVIDEENPGHLKLSGQPYDARVAGVVSGANGIHPGIQMQQEGLLEGGKNVALTGRVYVQAEASNGAIRPGDLLTTSATPGRAMKVTDHAKAQGAILGKAMTGLNEGQGMVLVLVTLQ